ncbi:MAG TPA: response regulator transcription factor [Chloroflexota bacterium]|nr:response regulator transcription factor [Chloroflexota bacterium]
MPKEKILVVDDEARILRLVRSNLEIQNYKVLTALDGESALTAAEMNDPDLIILDLMLPKMDGFEVCRRLREFSTVPIIVLTAKGEEVDKVKGLELGADDYLTKPFGIPELLARIKAVLRRTRVPPTQKLEPVFTLGDFSVNFAQRRVVANGRDVKLSPTEYKLLYELVTNAGRVVLHQDLLARVWGREYRDETEYLRVYIRYLRQKIEANPSSPTLILTEPGVGYRFAAPAEPAPAVAAVAASAAAPAG